MEEGEAMSGICDTCKRKDCYMEHDGDDSCPLYLKGKQSNYKRLFGTPERAARTLAGITCDDGGCEGCTLYGAECSYDSDVLLGWLVGDA